MNVGRGGASSLTYVIGTYPLLTTTFIDREIGRVVERGLDVAIISLRKPAQPPSEAQEALARHVRYVLPVSPTTLIRSVLTSLLRHPVRLGTTMISLLSKPHSDVRARFRTLLHLAEGVVVAAMLRRRPPDHLHAHFVDRATTVAWVCSRLLDVPFSATAHANDIYVAPVMLREKAAAASFLATCTGYNAAHLVDVVGVDADKVVAIRHGIDAGAFPPPGPRADPPVVLAVGQLKEKKGFRHLLEAVRLLADEGRRFSVVIVGEGPLRHELEQLIVSLGIHETVTLRGALPHGEVLRLMGTASVFVLPAVVAADGDRDGIPNVILEAMAMELPVVSTRHSGIPEAVQDPATGRLVEPGDPAALAVAVGGLLDDPDGSAAMGRAGRRLVEERFDLRTNVDVLLGRIAG